MIDESTNKRATPHSGSDGRSVGNVSAGRQRLVQGLYNIKQRRFYTPNKNRVGSYQREMRTQIEGRLQWRRGARPRERPPRRD